MTLFNTPRSDRNFSDHAGPAKLRLRFLVNDQREEIVLPVLLQPKMVQSTQFITLIGSGDPAGTSDGQSAKSARDVVRMDAD